MKFNGNVSGCLTAFLICIAAAQLRPGVDPDRAIASAFRLKDSTLRHSATLFRYTVSDQLDAVIALGSPHRLAAELWWGPQDQLGLFLQDRSRSDLVYVLVTVPHQHESLVRVEQAEPGFVVLSRRGEKSERIANLKLVFDARSKSLLRQIEYEPFCVPRVVERKGVPQFVATDGRHELLLAPSGDSFRIISKRAAQPEHEPYISHPTANLPPLPKTGYETFARVRPERVRDGYRPGSEFQEEIGSQQRFDGRLWFGNTFYDSEGITGVGGFGYFDPVTRNYTIYSPPEIVDWSVSAMLVDPDAVWLGLHHRGEWGDAPGGLLRWDRHTHDVRRYSLRSIIGRIVLYDGRSYLATSEGVGMVRDDRIDEFFIDGARMERTKSPDATPRSGGETEGFDSDESSGNFSVLFVVRPAQRVSVGARLGAPLTNAFDPSAGSCYYRCRSSSCR